MYFLPARVARMVETYVVFEAPNPWHTGRGRSSEGGNVRWTIGGCCFGSQRRHNPELTLKAHARGKRPRGIWAAIQCPEQRILRVLPPGLQEMFWSGLVQVHDLPRLVYELAPSPKDGLVRSAGASQIDARPRLFTSGNIVLALFWSLCAFTTGLGMTIGITRFLTEPGIAGWLVLGFTLLLPGLKIKAWVKERETAAANIRRIRAILTRPARMGQDARTNQTQCLPTS